MRIKCSFSSCRSAFVSMIRDENKMREGYWKQSLKAHWTGQDGGFADEFLQRRYNDFVAGWNSCNLISKG